MAWDDEMVALLRAVINDESVTQAPKYADERLQNLLVLAGQLVQLDIPFPTIYNLDINGPSITPDPTATIGRDNNFIVLTVLKAACILARGEVRSSGGQAIAIRDGRSSIDLRGKLQGLVAAQTSLCSEYDQARWNYKLSNSPAGAIITSPPGIGLASFAGFGSSEAEGYLYGVRDRVWFGP